MIHAMKILHKKVLLIYMVLVSFCEANDCGVVTDLTTYITPVFVVLDLGSDFGSD